MNMKRNTYGAVIFKYWKLQLIITSHIHYIVERTETNVYHQRLSRFSERLDNSILYVQTRAPYHTYYVRLCTTTL